MARLLALSFVLGTAQLCVACDKDASRAGAAAPANANTALSGFAQAREDYRSQKQLDLAWLDQRVTEMDAKQRTMSATSKAEYDNVLTRIKADRDAFARDLSSADMAVASTWDATKARLDEQWNHLRTATEKAGGTAGPAVATVKPAHMTCEEFSALAEVDRPKVLYWAEGFNQKGKPTGGVVDVGESDRWLPLVVADCAMTPSAPLATVVAKRAAAAPKPVASAPAPGTMTCSEFITYNETSKPKLVYWAEGFNKEGDATVAEMDIHATDRLVPTLTDDCRQTPKAKLGDQIRKRL